MRYGANTNRRTGQRREPRSPEQEERLERWPKEVTVSVYSEGGSGA